MLFVHKIFSLYQVNLCNLEIRNCYFAVNFRWHFGSISYPKQLPFQHTTGGVRSLSNFAAENFTPAFTGKSSGKSQKIVDSFAFKIVVMLSFMIIVQITLQDSLLSVRRFDKAKNVWPRNPVV